MLDTLGIVAPIFLLIGLGFTAVRLGWFAGAGLQAELSTAQALEHVAAEREKRQAEEEAEQARRKEEKRLAAEQARAAAAERREEERLRKQQEKDAQKKAKEDEKKRREEERERARLEKENARTAAKQAKDVIKLNCVNENLLAVKQLLNIADEAKTNLTEAKIRGDRSELVHQYSQITIADEKAKQAHDEATACVGEELHFVGKNDLEVDGPAVRHDPTDDGDNGQVLGEDPYTASLEDPGYASPFAPND